MIQLYKLLEKHLRPDPELLIGQSQKEPIMTSEFENGRGQQSRGRGEGSRRVYCGRYRVPPPPPSPDKISFWDGCMEQRGRKMRSQLYGCVDWTPVAGRLSAVSLGTVSYVPRHPLFPPRALLNKRLLFFRAGHEFALGDVREVDGHVRR